MNFKELCDIYVDIFRSFSTVTGVEQEARDLVFQDTLREHGLIKDRCRKVARWEAARADRYPHSCADWLPLPSPVSPLAP